MDYFRQRETVHLRHLTIQQYQRERMPVLFEISIACSAVLPLSTAVGFMPHRPNIPCNMLRFVALSSTISACKFRSRSVGHR